MRYLLIFLPVIIFSFFQATILPLNLVLIIVLGWGILRPSDQGLITAFFSGLILDLVGGKTLGLSSLAFLIVVFGAFLYRRRFRPSHPLYLFLFGFFSFWFLSFLTLEPFSLPEAVLTGFLLFLFWPIIFWFSQKILPPNEQLTLKLK